MSAPLLHTIGLRLLFAACTGLLALTGSAVRAAEPDAIGLGDSLRVSVFQSPELSGELKVSGQGSIRLPLAGTIEVVGLSPDAAATRIADRLQEMEILKAPDVSVTIVQARSRQVSVLGQVVRPGRYPVDEPANRLSDALALAGGIGPGGNDTVIVIPGQEPQARRLVSLAENPELAPGDTVIVDKAPVFYIYGEVQRAGAYKLEAPLSVLQAISLGGGLTRRGSERGILIRRRGPDGRLVDVSATLADTVRADDVIRIDERLF